MLKFTLAATLAAMLTTPSLAQTIPTPPITTSTPIPPSTSITSLHLGPSFVSDYHMLGSVIAANPTATSYSLACPSDYDCGFPGGLYWLEGPSTISCLNEFGANSASCVLTLGPVQSAHCTDVALDGRTLTTETREWEGLETWLHPVTITDGLEKILAVHTTESGGSGVNRTSSAMSETSTSRAGGSSSASETVTSVSSTGTATVTAGSVSSSSTSAAGVATVTGHVHVVAGVAAVFGGMLVL